MIWPHKSNDVTEVTYAGGYDNYVLSALDLVQVDWVYVNLTVTNFLYETSSQVENITVLQGSMPMLDFP